MIAIRTKDLIKRFPRTTGYRDLIPFRNRQLVSAVDGVSLEIEKGELFGLLGPNGAGKTTIIKMLCCLVLPTSGTAEILGHNVLKEEQAVKNLVGLVSAEERSFYWRLTGRENLQFYAALYHIPHRQARKRIDELLDLIEMSKEADMRFQNYSTGMRQKLAIARGLLSEPEVLFVDEPTRSLDPVSAKAIRQFIMEKIVRKGRTVILATHNLNEAEQMCSRMVIMNHGRVSALGSVNELRSLFQTQETCELQVSGISEDIISQLRLLEGVFDCNIDTHSNGTSKLVLKTSKRASVLPQILQIIVGSGVIIHDCQIGQLPLEDIFIHTVHDHSDGGEK
jgi:ABC-2 type transport system ATP-binding protein